MLPKTQWSHENAPVAGSKLLYTQELTIEFKIYAFLTVTNQKILTHQNHKYFMEVRECLLFHTSRKASFDCRYGHQTTANVPMTTMANFDTSRNGLRRFKHLPRRWLKNAGAKYALICQKKTNQITTKYSCNTNHHGSFQYTRSPLVHRLASTL